MNQHITCFCGTSQQQPFSYQLFSLLESIINQCRENSLSNICSWDKINLDSILSQCAGSCRANRCYTHFANRFHMIPQPVHAFETDLYSIGTCEYQPIVPICFTQTLQGIIQRLPILRSDDTYCRELHGCGSKYAQLRTKSACLLVRTSIENAQTF